VPANSYFGLVIETPALVQAPGAYMMTVLAGRTLYDRIPHQQLTPIAIDMSLDF
jgi:hypothetical protein